MRAKRSQNVLSTSLPRGAAAAQVGSSCCTGVPATLLPARMSPHGTPMTSRAVRAAGEPLVARLPSWWASTGAAAAHAHRARCGSPKQASCGAVAPVTGAELLAGSPRTVLNADGSGRPVAVPCGRVPGEAHLLMRCRSPAWRCWGARGGCGRCGGRSAAAGGAAAGWRARKAQLPGLGAVRGPLEPMARRGPLSRAPCPHGSAAEWRGRAGGLAGAAQVGQTWPMRLHGPRTYIMCYNYAWDARGSVLGVVMGRAALHPNVLFGQPTK